MPCATTSCAAGNLKAGSSVAWLASGFFFFSFFLKVQLCYKEPEWQTVTVASRLCKYRYTVQCRAKDALVSIHFQSHDSLSLNVECTQRIHREWGGDGLVEDTGSEMDGNEKAGDRCWLNEIRSAAHLLSKRFLKSLEWTEMKGEYNKKGIERTHRPLPCGLLYRRAIPSASGVEPMTSCSWSASR